MSPPSASLSSKSPAASRAGIDRKNDEPGRGDPVEAAEQAGRDRRAGPRDARDQRDALDQADDDRVGQVELASRARSWRRDPLGGPHHARSRAISATATTHSERRSSVITSLSSRPTMPTGIVPTMTYQPIR